MKLQYERKVNTILLTEQINAELGEGFALGAEFHEGVVEITRSGVGYTDENGNTAFQNDKQQQHVFHTILHINREVLSPEDRARIDAIVEAHDPNEKSEIERRNELRLAERKMTLARRFSPDTPPTMQELVAHVNALTQLIEQEAML